MPISKSPAAHPDCKAALDRAISAPTGVRVTLESPSSARNFQQRCNTFRVADRKLSARLYPETDFRHNTSVYDVLSVKLEGTAVVITQHRAEDLKMEEF